MVDEARPRAALRRIDVLVALQHHKVEVRDVLVLVLLHAPQERLVVHDLANVLVHKRVGIKCLARTQTVPLLGHVHNVDRRILGALEALVPAVPPAAAHICEALDLREAVDAVRLVGARILDAMRQRAFTCRVVVPARAPHARILVHTRGDLFERPQCRPTLVREVPDKLRARLGCLHGRGARRVAHGIY